MASSQPKPELIPIRIREQMNRYTELNNNELSMLLSSPSTMFHYIFHAG